ncbi:MAG TPA: hypothetical protein VNT26_01245, partial [Candidatus Sulfotelmatobacter sp.]|nr:hypothetical protein [Candidatus Sulfotelmatobacter sp.]
MSPASLFAKIVLVWLFGCLGARANEAAAIDECQYAEEAAARAAWQPMRGSMAAATATLDGRKALRLACHFAGTHIERASWDRAVQLDLASARGIQFQIRCRDASPVSHFSIYFQSGAGWYHATFFPESATDWNTIVIDKTDTQAEGKPAGWGLVKTIRISAWRGQDADTEFYLRDLRKTGALGADATVAILRAESAAQRWPEQARGLEQAAETVAQNLSAVGIGCAVLSDLDVTAERLQHAKLVILPYNPSLPEPVADALGQYLDRGGKLLAFYTVPERLRPAFKLQGGQHVKETFPGNFAALG